jgi:phosphoadenosine phosphosulfate reductase
VTLLPARAARILGRTGYQFEETLPQRERIRERYGIEVEMVRPELTVAEYEAEHGGPLYRIRPDQCCHDRKLVPLRRALVGYDAWISAIRRDQTVDRGRASVVQWDAKFNLVKAVCGGWRSCWPWCIASRECCARAWSAAMRSWRNSGR